MKRLLLGLLLSTSFIFPAIGEPNQRFFEQSIGTNITNKGAWIIIGSTGDGSRNVNARCSMGTEWNDGSYIWYIKDLIDDEVYMEFRNNIWNINDEPGRYTLRMNFKLSTGQIRGNDIVYSLINKNTIMLRNLGRTVTELMFNARELSFVMPGSIPNATIPLYKSREALNILSRCIDASKNFKLEGVGTGTTPGTGTGPGRNI